MKVYTDADGNLVPDIRPEAGLIEHEVAERPAAGSRWNGSAWEMPSPFSAYVDQNGILLGLFAPADAPQGATAVASLPPVAGMIWRNGAWADTAATTNRPILAQIAAIEAKQIRALREQAIGATAGTDGKTPAQRLQDYDDEIAALRAQLESAV
jgi:hypothetical protein